MSKNINKVSTKIAFQMMSKVYSPIIKFYKDMNKNEMYDYTGLCKSYCVKARDNCTNKNIQFFDDVKFSYSLDVVSHNIMLLYFKYYDVCGDAFFGALSKLFDCCIRDIEKL